MAYQDSSGQWFDDSGIPIADPNGSAPQQAVAPPITGGQWAPGTPQANGGTPAFIPAAGTNYQPLANNNAQVLGAAGPSGLFDTAGNPFAFSKPAAAPAPAPVDHTAGLGAAPGFTPPPYTPPPAFSYADFVAPDPNKLNDDPTYQYALKTEQDAIQKSAAARGVLNTGGTIHDLLQNAGDVANQGYQGLFSRSLQSYMANRGNAAENYRTNYDTQFRDPYSISYQGANDAYNSSLHNYDLSKNYAWMQNLFDFSKDQNQFDQRYKLLQLT